MGYNTSVINLRDEWRGVVCKKHSASSGILSGPITPDTPDIPQGGTGAGAGASTSADKLNLDGVN